MALLGQVLLTLLGAQQAPRPPSIVTMLLWGAAFLFGLLSLGALIFALFLILAANLGAPAAAVILAGALAALAALALLVAQVRRQAAAAQPRPPAEALLAMLLKLGQGAKLPKSETTAVVAAALAGLAVGYSPALRKALKNGVEQLFTGD